MCFPNYLYRARPGSEIVVVEIDPGVTKAAQEAFGLPMDAPIEIHHMDARNYMAGALRRTARRRGSVPPFDFIICDSVSDYSVPYQLTTVEFMEAGARLAEAGRDVRHEPDRRLRVGGFMNAMNQTFAKHFPQTGGGVGPELGPRNTTVFVGGAAGSRRISPSGPRGRAFVGIVLTRRISPTCSRGTGSAC
jgi:hypothetical protein